MAAQRARTARPPDPWSEVDIKLLPTEHTPIAFRRLRPMTILTVSAKAFTKALKGACESHDRDLDEAMLGF